MCHPERSAAESKDLLLFQFFFRNETPTPRSVCSREQTGLASVILVKLLPLAALLIFSCAISGFAADDRVVRPRSVDLQTFADPQFGPISIHATASEEGQVESVSLTFQSRKIDIPAEGLSDLKNADIASLHVTAAFSDPSKPWLLLKMNSYDPKYMKIPGQPATVSFVIENGEVVRRAISWRTDSASYSDDKTFKRPGAQ